MPKTKAELDLSRTPVAFRIRNSSLQWIDDEAERLDWSRTQMIRTLLALGTDAWKAGKR